MAFKEFMFLFKKDCKIKHEFEVSISNVDLSPTANHPINV